MKRSSEFLFVVLCLIAASQILGLAFQGTTIPLQPNQSTNTFKATIVKIDMATKTVTLKDPNGKTYTLVTDPRYNIDLSKYKVGDTVTATILTTLTTDKVTRARISKLQLIKLQ